MKIVRPLTLVLLLALAACGGNGTDGAEERKTAAGEVLGGSISDDMLPLDTITSESPPLREKGDEANDRPASGSDAAPTDAESPPPAEAASAAPEDDG